MELSTRLLDRYKKSLKIESDYEAAKHLGITKQAVSMIRRGGGLSVATAIKIGRQLRIDPIQFIAAEALCKKNVSEGDKPLLQRYAGRVLLSVLAAISVGTGTINSVEARTVAHNV